MADDPYRASARVAEKEPPADDHPEILRTWISSRACPICGVTLFAARQHGIRIDACGSCGGAWLPNDVARRMLASSVGASVAADLAKKADAHGTLSAGRAERCPDCEGLLERSIVEEVEVDVCRDHGTWFDRGELTTIVSRVVPQVEDESDVVLPQGMRTFTPEERASAVLAVLSSTR
jgi:Zn-finger nucleic acid-binding protein